MAKYNFNYIVNEKKRTVVCLLSVKYEDGDDNVFRGIAKCCDEDVFDAEAGKLLDKRRALLEAEKNELLRLDWKWSDEEIAQYKRDIFYTERRKGFLRKNVKKLKNEIHASLRFADGFHHE